jgi:hypothetical protein
MLTPILEALYVPSCAGAPERTTVSPTFKLANGIDEYRVTFASRPSLRTISMFSPTDIVSGEVETTLPFAIALAGGGD